MLNIGLVLSGVGIRGVAHIGAIKALEESSIIPTHIAGTSAGSVVGALYAAGIGWPEMLAFFKTVPVFHTKKLLLGNPAPRELKRNYILFPEVLESWRTLGLCSHILSFCKAFFQFDSQQKQIL